MKIAVAATLGFICVAMPAAASLQLGLPPLPEVEYRSPRQCQRALDRLVSAEAAIPQPPSREITRNGGDVAITVTTGAEWRSRFYSCRGATMVGLQGGGVAQILPPQPAK